MLKPSAWLSKGSGCKCVSGTRFQVLERGKRVRIFFDQPGTGVVRFRSGGVWVDGQPVDVHRVGQQVAGMLSGEGSVVIQADRASTTGVLIEVMDRLQQAGVEQVAVAASRSAP